MLSGTGEDAASLACIGSEDPEDADDEEEAPGLTEDIPLSGWLSAPDTAAATAAMPALDSTEERGFMPGGGGAPLVGTPAPKVLE